MWCHDVKCVRFPASVEDIAEGCFSHVYAESVVDSGSLRYKSENGFLIIPESVEWIGYGAFDSDVRLVVRNPDTRFKRLKNMKTDRRDCSCIDDAKLDAKRTLMITAMISG